MARLAAAAICVFALGPGAAALQIPLDPRAISEAIAIGQSRTERDRARFHAPYRLVVNRAPVDYAEVITPFRRVVIAAESRAATGDRTFGQRQGLELLGNGPPVVEVVVEMTFHPLNTFVGVPDYAVALVERGTPAIQPRAIYRIPRHGPRVEGAPLPDPNVIPLPTDQPMLGGTMIARFDAQLLHPEGIYDVVIGEGGKELARARADLARMR